MAYDQLIGSYMGAGLLAARPAAPNIKSGTAAFYYATDNNTLYVWTGSEWTTVSASAALTSATAVLGADVTMTSAATWYDGPSVSLAPGTWLVVGQMAFSNPGSGNQTVAARLYDGSTTHSLAALTELASGDGTIPLCARPVLGSTTTMKIQGYGTAYANTIMRAQVAVAVGNKATQLSAVKVA